MGTRALTQPHNSRRSDHGDVAVADISGTAVVPGHGTRATRDDADRDVADPRRAAVVVAGEETKPAREKERKVNRRGSEKLAYTRTACFPKKPAA